MKLFITGAAGYIGINIALAFRREGYRVYGLTANAENAPLLECNEIYPVIGSLSEPGSFKRVAANCDVIVLGVEDYQTSVYTQDASMVDALLEAVQRPSQPVTVIYTSSIWVYGSRAGQPFTEKSPLAPAEAAAGLPAVEQSILNAQNVKGIVIRPGVAYGLSGGLTGSWFAGAANGGVIEVIGDGYNHWAMVHVDDLAQGYLRAAQSNLGGEVFNLADSSRSTVMEMAGTAAQTAGNIRQLEFVPVAEAVQKYGPVAEALAFDQVVDASKARRTLDWRPKHQGFITEVDTYFMAWRAHRLGQR